MAGLKTVWLAKHWDAETPPVRTRLFAHLPASRAGAPARWRLPSTG
jgi:hypothetical protein